MSRKELLEVYSKLQARLKAKMLNLALSPKQERALRAEIRRFSRTIHRQARRANAQYTATTLTAYFLAGSKNLINTATSGVKTKLSKRGITSATSTPIKNAANTNSRGALRKMNAVTNEADRETVQQFNRLLKIRSEFGTGNLDKEGVDRLKIALKAFGVSDKKANQAARASKFEEVARSVMRDKNGAYMFTDKGGRRWSYKRWSQQTTRSYQDQSRRNGFLETANFADEDLAVIIDHPDESDSCRPYENQKISMFGKTKGYPTYAELQGNPDHIFTPTCRHQLRLLSPTEKR